MRLFAGIALDEATRAACASVAARLEATGFVARYVPPENFHITLAFLGTVEPSRLDELAKALDLASKHRPFDLTPDRLGSFPHERRPRIVYIGARDQGAPFRALAHDLRRRYEELGFVFDADAVAHVTIARINGGSRRPTPTIEVSIPTFSIRDVALFESVQVNGAIRYLVRRAVDLAQD